MDIQFDDLGFGDTGYNGADYPTPILDDLANNDAIKINFHYTENVCHVITSHNQSQLLKQHNSSLSNSTSPTIYSGLLSLKKCIINWQIFIQIRCQYCCQSEHCRGIRHIQQIIPRDLRWSRGPREISYIHQWQMV